MGIPNHITCLLRKLDGQEVPVRTRYGTTDWFKIGKGFHQGCILSLCLFNLYATTRSESSCYALKKTMHCNSPIDSSANNFINSKNIETYADSIPLIPWLHMGWYHISGDWAGLGPKVGLWWGSGTWEDMAGSAPP